jgi:hypothetical protein
LGLEVADKTVTDEVPPRFKVEFAACVNPPVPVKEVAQVNVPLLVTIVGDVIETVGIARVPINVWLFVLKVCVPVPAVKMPLLVIPPRKTTLSFPVLFQFPVAPIVTLPTNVFEPEVLAMVNVPSMVDIPFTVIVTGLSVLVVPAVTVRVPLTASAPVLVPLNVAPDRVRLVIP